MQERPSKDFDTWNNQKKSLDLRLLPEDFFFLEGEVWWAAIGVNIGHETDGKNDLHERPILVLKNINNDLLWALPITSTENAGDHFMNFHTTGGVNSYFLLRYG